MIQLMKRTVEAPPSQPHQIELKTAAMMPDVQNHSFFIVQNRTGPRSSQLTSSLEFGVDAVDDNAAEVALGPGRMN
jgi:hypothetical protein